MGPVPCHELTPWRGRGGATSAGSAPANTKTAAGRRCYAGAARDERSTTRTLTLTHKERANDYGFLYEGSTVCRGAAGHCGRAARVQPAERLRTPRRCEGLAA